MSKAHLNVTESSLIAFKFVGIIAKLRSLSTNTIAATSEHDLTDADSFLITAS